MNFINEDKEKEVQDFIFRAMENRQQLFLTIDCLGVSQSINDCIIAGLINTTNTLEIYFFVENGEIENCLLLKKINIDMILMEKDELVFHAGDTTIVLCYQEE